MAANEADISYTIAGRLLYERPLVKGGGAAVTGEKERQRFEFVVGVADSRWYMHVATEDPLTQYDYCETAYDGVNLYYVRSFRTMMADRANAGERVGTNSCIASVFRRTVPVFSLNHEVGPLWLAYASGAFFATNHSADLLSVATRGVGPKLLVTTLDNYAEPASVVRGAARPNLPVAVTYVEHRLTNSYPTPFTNIVFRVDATTNVHGLALPLRATLATYFPYRQPGEPHPRILQGDSYQMVTTNTQEGSGFHGFTAGIDGTAFVTDCRFLNRGGLRVGVINYYARQWYSDDQVTRLPDYKRAVARARASSGETASAQWRAFTLLVFIALIIGPAVLLWKRSRLSP